MGNKQKICRNQLTHINEFQKFESPNLKTGTALTCPFLNINFQMKINI